MNAPPPTDDERATAVRESFAMALKAYRERTGARLGDAIIAFGPCRCGHRGHLVYCRVPGCPCRVYVAP